MSKHMRVPGECWHIVQLVIEVSSLMWRHGYCESHADFMGALSNVCVEHSSRFYRMRGVGKENE